ncbi:MAG: hypothetical protein AAFX94_22695 [Myxococcota bacterium]
MGFDLRDRFETTDGSRPEGSGLDPAHVKALPLSCVDILRGGDVFDSVSGRPSPEGPPLVERWLAENVTVAGTHRERFAHHAQILLSANPQLARRMLLMKPIRVSFLEPGEAPKRRGLPRSLRTGAAGLFWDHPKWDSAQIFYRVEFLDEEPALIAHELGHAVHYLALGAEERNLTYQLLRRTFGHTASMDEVFAIYTEREFLDHAFRERDLKGPGIYGAVRRQWSDDHVFTRFIRKLYYPHKPLAGPKLRGWL